LPKTAKESVSKFFKDSIAGLDNEIDLYIKDQTRNEACKKYMRKILQTYDDFMWAKDFTDKLPKFWEHTRRLDKIRGHSFEKSCPEMYKLIKDYEYETTP